MKISRNFREIFTELQRNGRDSWILPGFARNFVSILSSPRTIIIQIFSLISRKYSLNLSAYTFVHVHRICTKLFQYIVLTNKKLLQIFNLISRKIAKICPRAHSWPCTTCIGFARDFVSDLRITRCCHMGHCCEELTLALVRIKFSWIRTMLMTWLLCITPGQWRSSGDITDLLCKYAAQAGFRINNATRSHLNSCWT